MKVSSVTQDEVVSPDSVAETCTGVVDAKAGIASNDHLVKVAACIAATQWTL